MTTDPITVTDADIAHLRARDPWLADRAVVRRQRGYERLTARQRLAYDPVALTDDDIAVLREISPALANEATQRRHQERAFHATLRRRTDTGLR